MATYVPNATQTTEPVEARSVESAALEFRTLKTQVNTLAADIDAVGLSTLKVPEATVGILPVVAARAGKVLGFDAGGDPTMVVVAGTTDPSLRSDLATPSGANLVGYLSGTVADKFEEVLSVKDFGAVGGGTVDDKAAIIAALTAAVARANSGIPTTLWFPTDIYKVSGVLGTYTCSNLTIDFNGSTIDASAASFSGALLRFDGSIGTYSNLTSSGVEGNYQVLVNSSGFTRGDWVKIISDSIWDDNNTNTRYGELNKILTSDNVDTSLPPDRLYLSAPLMTGYLTSKAGRVAKVNMLTNITVKNGKLLGPTVIRDSATGLRFQRVDGVIVTGMTFSDFDDRGIYIKDSSGAIITSCQFRHSRPISLGYGVSFVDAAQDSVVSLCNFEDIRHALSTNNNTSTDYGVTRRVTFNANTVLYSARASVTSSTFTVDTTANTVTMSVPSATFGEARLVRLVTTGTLPGGLSASYNYYLAVVVASTTFTLHLSIDDAIAAINPVDITSAGTGTQTATAYTGGDAVDTHGGADFIKITNNQIVGSSNSGINVECPSCEILGNTIIGSEGCGIYFHSEADRVGNALIANNRIERSGGAGILAGQGTRGTAFEMRRMTIANNSIHLSGQDKDKFSFSQGIALNDVTNATQDCFTVTGNTISTGSAGGIYGEWLNGASITGNSIFNNTGIGILIERSTKVSITGNSVLTATASGVGYSGISITGQSTGCVITGNVISSVAGTVPDAYALNVADAATSIMADKNSISGHDFRINLGTGISNSGLTATGSVSYNPGLLADGEGVTTTVTATGASIGDYVKAVFSEALVGVLLTAWVSATNTVSVRFQNETGAAVDLPVGTLRVASERLR
jgi:hypothetical protein